MAAADQICQYFKYGHCRYEDRCRHQHVREICEEVECNIKLCRRRHPRVCVYFSMFRRCKFNSHCNYKHEHFDRNALPSNEVSSIMEKVTKLEEIVANLEMENNQLKMKLEALETIQKDQIEAKLEATLRTPVMSRMDDVRSVVDAHIDDRKFRNADQPRTREVLGPGFRSNPSWSFKTQPRTSG